jgi:hypothetical protein
MDLPHLLIKEHGLVVVVGDKVLPAKQSFVLSSAAAAKRDASKLMVAKRSLIYRCLSKERHSG